MTKKFTNKRAGTCISVVAVVLYNKSVKLRKSESIIDRILLNKPKPVFK